MVDPAGSRLPIANSGGRLRAVQSRLAAAGEIIQRICTLPAVGRISRRRDRVPLVLAYPLMNLPSVIPVMLLQQCNVFPHGLLPLYIFEPRYRAMLKHALQTDRMLCIGTLTPSGDGEAVESDERIHEFSTASVLRACVGNADGTSHLVLQGMQRVRFVSWEQYEPFRIARIDPVENHTANPVSANLKGQRLLDQVLGLIRQDSDTGRKLAGQLQQLNDPAHLADFVAGNLIPDALSRQPLLGMAEVEDRLDYLMDLLPAPGKKPAKP